MYCFRRAYYNTYSRNTFEYTAKNVATPILLISAGFTQVSLPCPPTSEREASRRQPWRQSGGHAPSVHRANGQQVEQVDQVAPVRQRQQHLGGGKRNRQIMYEFIELGIDVWLRTSCLSQEQTRTFRLVSHLDLSISLFKMPVQRVRT